MRIVRGVWRVLVGVKDALVLLFMLLFFGLLYATLAYRPNRAIESGALVLRLQGTIVEQPAPVQFGQALQGVPANREYRLRDVVHAIDTAATDARVKTIVLDLDGFLGGGQVALGDVGEALDRARRAGKPIHAYALGYSDDAYQLAAHASQIWLDPMGAVLFAGPGGSRLYYKGLIDRLGVNAHIYRVGSYKSAVEPFLRADQSPEARAASEALAGALWSNWQSEIARARPRARFQQFVADPGGVATASGGDLSGAALRAGLVDKVASRAEFERFVAGLAGAGTRGKPYAGNDILTYGAANPYPNGSRSIAIATVAGTIVDGEADSGSAGGDTISRLIDEAVARGTVKALVLRVDSPGGSATASERIRQSLAAARAKGIPVIVSMSSVAASGGYWVSTAADRVFAEPGTITGSIGVFGIIPTFENAIRKIGVTSDGVRTTPLSGQPDLFGGTTPAFDAIGQASVENIYGRFISLVAQARRLPVARVNEIGQGRVWDGGSARQLGLVDQFGGLDAAIADAARRAGLDPDERHAVWLEKPKTWTQALAEGYAEDDSDRAGDALAMLARLRASMLSTAVADAELLTQGGGVQARCLECPAVATPRVETKSLWALLLARVTG